jgi:hypothetical protein
MALSIQTSILELNTRARALPESFGLKMLTCPVGRAQGGLVFVRGGSTIGGARGFECLRGGSAIHRKAQQKAGGDKKTIGKSFACPNKLFRHTKSSFVQLKEQRSDRSKKSVLKVFNRPQMRSSVLA